MSAAGDAAVREWLSHPPISSPEPYLPKLGVDRRVRVLAVGSLCEDSEAEGEHVIRLCRYRTLAGWRWGYQLAEIVGGYTMFHKDPLDAFEGFMALCEYLDLRAKAVRS